MSTRLVHSTLALAVLAFSPVAFAQNTDLISATVNTCNVKGSVSITVLGLTTTLPVTCINPSQQTAPGNDEDSATGDVNVSVPGVLSVADVSAPYGESNYINQPNKTWLVGGTTAEDVSLVQDLVSASGVRGLVICESSTGDPTVNCKAGTQIAQLLINGQPVALPPDPIPLNYPVAVTGGALQITLPGLGNLSVPVAGQLTLNKFISHGEGTQQLTLEHVPLHLDLHGSVQLAGIGVVGVTVKVMDYTESQARRGLPIDVVSSGYQISAADAACLRYGELCQP